MPKQRRWFLKQSPTSAGKAVWPGRAWLAPTGNTHGLDTVNVDKDHDAQVWHGVLQWFMGYSLNRPTLLSNLLSPWVRKKI